jgi:hypothetical protein
VGLCSGPMRRGQVMVSWRCVFRWVQPGTALPRGAAAECHPFAFMRRRLVRVGRSGACVRERSSSLWLEGRRAGEGTGGEGRQGCVCARGCAWVRMARCAWVRGGAGARGRTTLCSGLLPNFTYLSHSPRPAAVPPIARGDGDAAAGVPYSGLAVGGWRFCMHWCTHASPPHLGGLRCLARTAPTAAAPCVP